MSVSAASQARERRFQFKYLRVKAKYCTVIRDNSLFEILAKSGKTKRFENWGGEWWITKLLVKSYMT